MRPRPAPHSAPRRAAIARPRRPRAPRLPCWSQDLPTRCAWGLRAGRRRAEATRDVSDRTRVPARRARLPPPESWPRPGVLFGDDPLWALLCSWETRRHSFFVNCPDRKTLSRLEPIECWRDRVKGPEDDDPI